MSQISVLQWTPLATAAIWLAIVGYQLLADRYHTWTEGYFLVLCMSVGAYALIDFFFFNAPALAGAWLGAVTSLIAVSFIALFFLLYGLTLWRGMRRAYLSLIPPIILADGLMPTQVLAGLEPFQDPGPPYLPVYHLTGFGVWVVLLLAYVCGGLWAQYRTSREVARYSKRLSRRMGMILAAFFFSVLLGGATNVVLELYFSFRIFPLFSTLLVVPGLFLLTVVSPEANRALYTVLRRARSKAYTVVAGLVMYRDGTLIGSLADPSFPMVDADLVGAMVDIIQNYMHRTFPGQRGGWIRAIEHGGYQIILERGKFVTVVLVLDGRETDFLRRHMRDQLNAYERGNREVFSAWKGIQGSEAGTLELLRGFFREAEGEPMRTPG